MSTIQEILHEAKQQALDCHLGDALTTMRGIYEQRPSLYGRQTFENIDHSHRLMLDYMLRGYKDEQRAKLYMQLLRKLYALVADLEISWRCKNSHVYVQAFQRADHLNLSAGFIQEVLECFVGDVAMLSLEAVDVAERKKRELYARHQTFMDRLFCAVFVACQWSDAEADDLGRILLSPTIDQNDALLIVSAITLSAIQQFDLRKTQMLARVFQGAGEPELRQRAFVGFVLSLRHNKLFYEEQTAILCELNRQNNFANSLLEMQKQVFFCLNADRDSEKMENDIIPNIMKHSNLRVTRFGIEEKDPDKLEEILHPEAEEKAAEEVEKGMERMQKMMKSGADIYYGGFKMMKRFPFFSSLSNWFAPFYAEHPALTSALGNLDQMGFLKVILAQDSFCNSDKYSFIFAVAHVAAKLPPSFWEMAKHEEALGMMTEADPTKADLLARRSYLQDLYRFFRLHPLRSELSDPFGGNGAALQSSAAFFLASPLFDGLELNSQRLALASYLHKKKMKASLSFLLVAFKMESAEYYALKGYSLLETEQYELASEAFSTSLSLVESKELQVQALRGLAMSLMRLERYDDAAQTYSQLSALVPDSITYPLNQCVALLEIDKTTEALELLFKLNYLHPDDKNTLRVLAWALLLQKKTAQAERYYAQLLSEAHPSAEDFLNAGYAAWCEDDVQEAVRRFCMFLKKNMNKEAKKSLAEAFSRDGRLLSVYGKTDVEVQLMLEAATEDNSILF